MACAAAAAERVAAGQSLPLSTPRQAASLLGGQPCSSTDAESPIGFISRLDRLDAALGGLVEGVMDNLQDQKRNLKLKQSLHAALSSVA